MRKAKIVYLDGDQQRELLIPPELLFDSEKKEKFIKEHIGNVDYAEYRYYDESDEVTENVSELPPAITEAPVHTDTSVINSEIPSIEILTAEIKMYLHIANQSIIEVGKRLILAKEMLPHGEWYSWLKNNFNLSNSMATRFMQIAERFSNRVSIHDFDISTFKLTQLIALLSLPEGEEEKFIEQKAAEGNPVEDMTVKNLRAEIKKYRKEYEQLQNNALNLEGKLSVAESSLNSKNIHLEHLKDGKF